jgi:trehalose 6-phosphate phosphatase
VSTAELFSGFRADPGTSGVFTDFDGTLSQVVADPAAARPVPGAVEVLHALAAAYARVAVISGRPVEFLVDTFGPQLFLSGLYGLEEVRDGVRMEHPDAARWRSVIDEVVREAADSAPRGARIEPKGLSVTVHYREHPEQRGAIEDWVRAAAGRHGLDVRPARQSVELHPPVDADKGTVLGTVSAGLDRVCFLGDDIGDLPAFTALDQLRGAGIATVKVGVVGSETPPEVLAAADLTVEGPAGALSLLRSLLP